MGLEEDTSAMYFRTADGKFRIKADENTPGAQRRVVELSDGSEKVLYEKVYQAINGYLVGISSSKHEEYGITWNITLTDGDSKFIIGMKHKSRYLISFLERLPNVVLTEPVRLRPWKNAKGNIGISVQQGVDKNGEWIKLRNYFREYDEEGMPTKVINGMPSLTQEQWQDEDEVSMHIIKVQKFLTDYVSKNILPDLKEIRPTYNTNLSQDKDAEHTGLVEEEPPASFSEEPPEDDLPF